MLHLSIDPQLIVLVLTGLGSAALGAASAWIARPKTKAEADRAVAEAEQARSAATTQLTGSYEQLLDRAMNQIQRLERKVSVQEDYIASMMGFILEANNLTTTQRNRLASMRQAFTEKMDE